MSLRSSNRRQFIVAFAALLSAGEPAHAVLNLRTKPPTSLCARLLHRQIELGTSVKASDVGHPLLRKYLATIRETFGPGLRPGPNLKSGYAYFSAEGVEIYRNRAFLEYRARKDPALAALLEELGLWKSGAFVPVATEADALKVAKAISRKIEAILKEFPRDELAVPGFFAVASDGGGSRLIEWRLSGRASGVRTLGERGELETQMAFSGWSGILGKYGLIPLSFESMSYHDFSHLIAALLHPREEMLLQRRFYRYYNALLDGADARLHSRLESRWAPIADYLFEGASFPKLAVLRAHFGAVPTGALSEFADSDGVLSFARFGRGALPKSAEALLDDFERRFLSESSRFYGSFDGYGGDFYDVFNHHDGEFDRSMEFEKIYVAYRTGTPDERELARRRLFVAYYNADRLGISFERAVEDATSPTLPRDGDGIPFPWRGTLTEKYFRSYSDVP